MTSFAVSWAAAVLAVTPAAPALDRDSAMSASVEDLARASLAAAAPRFVEVERPNYPRPPGAWRALGRLRFATAAEGAGMPGLCKATVAWIDVGGGSPPIETQSVYKIVGDLAPLPDMWNPTYEAALAKQCAAAGRVIPTGQADFGQATFFQTSSPDGVTVWKASRALQLAIAQARADLPVACTPPSGEDLAWVRELAANAPEAVERRQNQAGCAQAGATLAGLSLERLLRLDVGPCPGQETDVACLTATFLRYAYDNHQVLWTVRLKYTVARGHDRDVTAVREVRLQPDYAVYD